MRKFVASILVLGALVAPFGGPAFAEHDTVSDSANAEACKGQQRAFNASTSDPGTRGDVASERQGDNARLEQLFKEQCVAEHIE